jgi:hypothetical protein
MAELKLFFVDHKKLPALLGLFFFFVLLIGAAYFFFGQTAEKHMLAGVEKTFADTEAFLVKRLQKAESVLNEAAFVVENGLRDGMSPGEIRAYLTQLLESLKIAAKEEAPVCLNIFAYTQNTFISSLDWEVPENYDPWHRIWYITGEGAIDSIAYTKPYIDFITQRSVVSLTRALMDIDGKIHGVIALDIDYAMFSRFIKDMGSPKNSYGMLVDKDFAFIVHPADIRLEKSMDSMGSRYTSLAKKLQHDGNQIQIERMWNYQDIRVSMYFKRLFNGWYLGLTVPVLSYYQKVYTIVAALSTLALISLVFFSLFFNPRNEP